MVNHSLPVLYIEDDELVRRASVQSLQLAGFDVTGHASVESASRSISADFPGVIVSDIRLPGASGLDLLAQCHERAPEVPVILVTGHGDISMAVQAMRDGAYAFIEKPFASERLIDTVRRALERRTLLLENHALRRELAGQHTVAPRIIGRSPVIEQVRRLIANVAPTDASVLINGDTGAGKELIARSLHELSPRRDKPFIAVNCGALPEPMFESEMFGYEPGAFTGAAKRRIGKLEYASGGTLFLDEIESMPPLLQVKLLRVLQDGVLERLGSNQTIQVNCRIVAAAKGDMAEHVAAGTFRRDLLYRLNVVTIALPPLAERREDIVPLFEHFLLDAAVRYQRSAPILTDRQRAGLMQRDWPGNVRELRNAADRRCSAWPRTP
jgi:two-component system C4-dicarboxylate transport response regulator DctD